MTSKHPARGAALSPGDHKALASAIRALAMDAVEAAASGHPGMPMGMADAAVVLFSEPLRFHPLLSPGPPRPPATSATPPTHPARAPARAPGVPQAPAIASLAPAMDAVGAEAAGQPGMPMVMADAAVVRFSEQLLFDPGHPDWPDRDRFVLSAGHGSMLLYALLHLTGYPGMTIEELKRFRQLGSRTPGHPEYREVPGAETTTGPPGQGFRNAVGLAIDEPPPTTPPRLGRRRWSE